MAAYKKLFNSPYLADMDIAKRKRHILTEQLFGLTDDFTCLMLSERMLYGYAQYGKKNIKMIEDLQSIVKTTDKKLVAERLGKELGGQMEFDLVIGNPPYNNDLYLDFVTVAQHLSSKYTVMITPAKWQAKGGKKNEDFRKNVVPYMSKIVYYPDCCDIFTISEWDGISYYLIDKVNVYKEHYIKNISSIHSEYKNCDGNIVDINSLYVGITRDIINKTLGIKKIKICSIQNKSYKVLTNLMICTSGKQSFSLYAKDGMCLVTNPYIVTDDTKELSSNYKIMFSSDNKDECNSFVSYCNTKFVRFLLLSGIVGISITASETWRFVPDPITFDHIFTDEELYKKYNLTPEEINIIESVIKERK